VVQSQHIGHFFHDTNALVPGSYPETCSAIVSKCTKSNGSTIQTELCIAKVLDFSIAPRILCNLQDAHSVLFLKKERATVAQAPFHLPVLEIHVGISGVN
jgi:hypothetical protein